MLLTARVLNVDSMHTNSREAGCVLSSKILRCLEQDCIALARVDSNTGSYWCCSWAARYNTWLLIKLTPKGVVFSFLFFSTGAVRRIGCGE